MNKDDGKEIVDLIRHRLSAPQPSAAATALAVPAAPAVPAADDPYEQLRKLGDLLDAGILTQEEFEEKKATGADVSRDVRPVWPAAGPT